LYLVEIIDGPDSNLGWKKVVIVFTGILIVVDAVFFEHRSLFVYIFCGFVLVGVS